MRSTYFEADDPQALNLLIDTWLGTLPVGMATTGISTGTYSADRMFKYWAIVLTSS
jgi:hypothetical protein